MNKKFFLSSVILIITMSVLLGCQSNPASPDTGNQPDQLGNQRQDASAHRMNLGSYLIEFNKENLTATPIPLRSSELHLNLTKIFVNTMGLSVQIEPGESDPPNGLFAVDFTLIHPLPEHPEFSAFDIKGIVMAPGTLAIGSLIFSDIDETRVENADGYTRWWNPTEFTEPGIFGYTDGLFTNTTSNVLTATVNPYKYFADILDHSSGMQPVYNEPLTDEMGRGVFSDGSTNTRRYLIQFPMDPGPVVVFGYVIDGSWDIPDPNPPLEVPDDFPIAANQPEAYHVAVAEKVNTLFYDTETDLAGGVLRIQANVHDWQGQNNGDIASEVDAVRVFSPGLFNGGADVGYDSQTAVKTIYKADLT
ncbi:hypothetical protein KAU08_02110, partial [bacterium]|nr:hypothetical protein [bacterium]